MPAGQPQRAEQADETGGINQTACLFGQRIAEQIEAQHIVIQRKQRSVGVHLTVSGLKRRENIGVRQIQQRNEVQHTSNQKGKDKACQKKIFGRSFRFGYLSQERRNPIQTDERKEIPHVIMTAKELVEECPFAFSVERTVRNCIKR